MTTVSYLEDRPRDRRGERECILMRRDDCVTLNKSGVTWSAPICQRTEAVADYRLVHSTRSKLAGTSRPRYTARLLVTRASITTIIRVHWLR